MKKKIQNIFGHAKDIVRDYRYKVHENAGICFAYYLIMSIFPICSLLSYFAAIFDVDLTLMARILEKFLTPEFSEMIVNAIVNTNTSATSIIVIAISIFVVSRGIHQLYGISKNMFPPVHERTNLIEQVFTILKTVTVFILLLLIIAILTFFPIILSSIETSRHFIMDETILFFCFLIIFFLLYKIIPDVHVHVVDITIGSAVAGFLLLVLINVLELYFSIADYQSVYGPLATIVVIMISCTLVAEVIYIGMYAMFEAHMYRLIIEMTKEYDPVTGKYKKAKKKLY